MARGLGRRAYPSFGQGTGGTLFRAMLGAPVGALTGEIVWGMARGLTQGTHLSFGEGTAGHSSGRYSAHYLARWRGGLPGVQLEVLAQALVGAFAGRWLGHC